MAIYVGNNEVNLGDISKVYIGTSLIYTSNNVLNTTNNSVSDQNTTDTQNISTE